MSAPEKSLVKATLEQLREKIRDLIEKHPEKAVTVLTEWIKKPAAQKAPKGATIQKKVV